MAMTDSQISGFAGKPVVSLRYRDECRRGQAPEAALEHAFHSVGEAIVVSSICLSLGFSVLLLSQWGGLVSFGMIASFGVLLALAGDLILLPSALLSFDRKREAEA